MRTRFNRSLQVLRGHAKENGIIWTACFCSERVLNQLATRVRGSMRKRELNRGLRGENTVRRNLLAWETWDWQSKGEEWTQSQEWKQSLIDDVLLQNIVPNQLVLEIGPGGGRWTEVLQRISKKLIVVDVTPKCIEICKERFWDCTNIEYFVNDGKTLSFLPDNSIDAVWSFDVFVHISPFETDEYIKELCRVLRPGGRGVIHHPAAGVMKKGWRSNTTAEMFAEMLKKHSLRLVNQFDSWGPGGRFDVRHCQDQISVFEKS